MKGKTGLKTRQQNHKLFPKENLKMKSHYNQKIRSTQKLSFPTTEKHLKKLKSKGQTKNKESRRKFQT